MSDSNTPLVRLLSEAAIGDMVSEYVVKRDGRREKVSFDKVITRIEKLSEGLNVNVTAIAQATIAGLYSGITTAELDEIAVRIANDHKVDHPDYSKLATRISMSNLHKSTPASFVQCMNDLHENMPRWKNTALEFINEHRDRIDAMIVNERDYVFEYNSIATLFASYLQRVYADEMIGDEPVCRTLDTDSLVVSKEEVRKIPRTRTVTREDGTTVREIVGYNYVRTNGDPLIVKKVSRVYDRPQYMCMRVAVGIHHDTDYDLETRFFLIKQTYDMLSQHMFTHATPTLFNAMSQHGQYNSCFLLGTYDSIEEIERNLTNCALISKWAGGIGVHMSNIRAQGSVIKSTGGKSSGLKNQLRIYDATCRTWDQGGRRDGAIAIYLEPWHADIITFLRMKRTTGADSERARKLSYALWVPDLFVEAVRKDEKWSLFSPDTAPCLPDIYDGMPICECGAGPHLSYNTEVVPKICAVFEEYSVSIPQWFLNGKRDHNKCTCEKFVPLGSRPRRDVFTMVYRVYESVGLATMYLPAREIFAEISETQRDSGNPYVCFKDHVNRMSNQIHIGVVKSSNLCAEITEVSDNNSYASCTLASINLRAFVKDWKDGITPRGYAAGDKFKPLNGKYYDFEALYEIVRVIVRNLDRVVEINDYPVDECVDTAKAHRPIGIGVQALANVFMEMRIPFVSDEALNLDCAIMETIYHAALAESNVLAKKFGSYKDFEHSLAASGVLHPDLYVENQRRMPDGGLPLVLSGLYDWDEMRERVKTGLRCTLHVALMPTASTAEIMGNVESFEPMYGIYYTKSSDGKRVLIANQAIRHLIEAGLWNEKMRTRILNNRGSIANFDDIPADIRQIYATVWDLPQRELMRRAALRTAFVDQSQSLNIHVPKNTDKVLASVFMSGHQFGLKTGSYYIRQNEAVTGFSTHRAEMREMGIKHKMIEDSTPVCTMKEGCITCSS